MRGTSVGWHHMQKGWMYQSGNKLCLPPCGMKETRDPDQEDGFMGNIPQMLEDLRAGWGSASHATGLFEEPGPSPSSETALSCTELAVKKIQC